MFGRLMFFFFKDLLVFHCLGGTIKEKKHKITFLLLVWVFGFGVARRGILMAAGGWKEVANGG